MIITIDGPSGAGKSTMAKLLSKFFNINTLDTGAIYRTVAYIAKKEGVDWDDEEGMTDMCIDIACISSDIFFYDRTGFCCNYNNQLLTHEIRTDEMSDGASKVSAQQGVRDELLQLQRDLSRDGIISEGRDSGTVIFPDADIKFYLDGNIVDRAQRRSLQNNTDFSVTCKAIEVRDERDMNREIAPLKKAEDAILIDSTDKSINDVFIVIVQQIKEKFPLLTILPESIENTANFLYSLEKNTSKESLQMQLSTKFVV